MSLFSRKKEYDYFGYFETCAQYAYDGALYLQNALATFDAAALPGHVEAMHKIENDADMAKHDMHQHLSKEFITPIEREDIATLAQNLDDVVDTVEDGIRNLYMYNVTALRAETAEFTALIVKCCAALVTAAKEFRHFKKSKTLIDRIIEVNAVENDGDKLYATAMRKLYTEESDTRSLLVWTTMFDCLEQCLDTCEDAADTIENIVMKNS